MSTEESPKSAAPSQTRSIQRSVRMTCLRSGEIPQQVF